MVGGWEVVGGWTKTKLMLFSTQVEVVVELKLELSLAKIGEPRFWPIYNRGGHGDPQIKK